MHATLTFALRATEKAGDNLRYIRSELPKRLEEGQTAESFISWAMEKGSQNVAKILKEAYPDHGITSVQFGEIQAPKGRSLSANIHWYFSLIVGEENFVQGLPEVAVYAYQMINGRVEHSAISFPFLDQSYTASRGQGAQNADHRMKQSERKDQFHLLNIAADSLDSDKSRNLALALLKGNNRVLISGNSVLDVCRVAAEKADLAYAYDFDKHDLDAVSLIAQESGCISGTFNGSPIREKGEYVVSSKRLFKQFVGFIRKDA